MIYLVLGLSTGVGYCVVPILKNFINFWVYDIDPTPELPYRAAFPYDVHKSPVFELTYAIFVYATYMTVLIAVSFDN